MTNVIFTATSRACQLSTHISFIWFCAKIRTWWHLLGLLFIKREFTFELDIWQFLSQTKERLNILSCYHLLVVTTVNPKIKWYIGELLFREMWILNQKTKELFMTFWKAHWFKSSILNNKIVCVDLKELCVHLDIENKLAI